MQVAPIKPTLKAHGTKRLKLKYDESPSNFAFKVNSRRYIKSQLATSQAEGRRRLTAAKVGRCSFTLSNLC